MTKAKKELFYWDYDKDLEMFVITPKDYYDRYGYLDSRGDVVPEDILPPGFYEEMESYYGHENKTKAKKMLEKHKNFIKKRLCLDS